MSGRAIKAAQRMPRRCDLRDNERAAHSAPRLKVPFFEIPHWMVQLLIMRTVIGILLFESLKEYGD